MRERRNGKPGKLGRRVGTWLAIGLFFLQTFVAAVHFHPDGLGFYSAHPGDSVAGPSSDVERIGLPDAPPGLPTHGDCPLCLAIHLAGSAIAPPAPTLGDPTQPDVVLPLIELRLPSAPYSLFRTRAPPIA